MSTERPNLTGVIARKDFEDAVRSKMLWSLTGILIAIVALAYGGVWWAGNDPDPDGLVSILAALLQLIVPLVALIAGYMSIVGERGSGSIKVLLGLPPKRSDVVFGKLLGRAGVVSATIVVAVIAATLLSGLLFQSVPITQLLGVGAATILLGLAFVGIAVGVSAAVATRGRAMAAVIGLYFVFLLFWDLLTAGLYRLVEGSLPAGTEYEAWYLFTQWLNPINAHAVLIDWALDITPPNFTIVLFGPFNPADLDTHLAGEAPIYLQNWTPIFILLGICLLPAVLGYVRFRGVDLG